MICYKVTGEIDPTTSLGTYLIGIFEKLENAEKAAIGKGLWGAAGYIEKIEIEKPHVEK